MPYVSIGRLGQALQSLQRFHAFFGVTFLSMKKSGVKVGSPISWGSQQENELLAAYYAPPGAPAGKPFLVPYGRPDPETGSWKNPKYSGGTLQRARTTDNFAKALQHPSADTWAFAPNHVETLSELLPLDENKKPIRLPVFDVIAWIYRERELPNDLAKVLKLFRDEFQLDDKEFRHLFAAGPEDAAQFFFPNPASRDDLIRLIRGIPEGPSVGSRTEAELIAAIEHHIGTEQRLELPAGFVRSFYYSLKTQRFVVLAGRPGTGKTAFARAFARALSSFFPNAVSELIVSVGPDFSESDVIGYEKIAGDLAATELTRRLFLSGRPRDIYVIILDEMNLAQADHYLARILPAIESDAPVELPGLSSTHQLPADTFIVATVNSFVEESTRLPLSGPVKRRANVIEMPNLLETIVASGSRGRFDEVLVNLLKQTHERYLERKRQGLESALDKFRISDLAEALKASSPVRATVFVEALWQICIICAKDSRTSLTFGVLQDVLDFVALSGTDTLKSLDRQIAQKIVPQLAGPASVARELLNYVATLKSTSHSFTDAHSALEQLLATEDPSSGAVYFRY